MSLLSDRRCFIFACVILLTLIYSVDLNHAFRHDRSKSKILHRQLRQEHVEETTEEAGLANDSSHEENDEGEHEQTKVHIISFEWERVKVLYVVCLWIMVASLAKMGFHYTKLPNVIPESCLLILVGFFIGGILHLSDSGFAELSRLDSDFFFLVLLPPIMLEAGYFMPARSFFDNLGTILLYAVVGTLFNAMMVGFTMYGIASSGIVSEKIILLECLVFGSLISAVDPVAVLVVFEEVHVNEVLHILVFGESLLNDAVTVVLYHTFVDFVEIYREVGTIPGSDIASGFASFFVVSIGGTLIGLIWGIMSAFITRFTHKVRVIEPAIVFIMSYMAYLTAEIFHLSGILAIVFCAMFMKPYVEENISQKSHTTIKYFMKMLSSISETIIFIFLGITTLVDSDQHKWDTAFVIFTLIFCLLYRFIGVIWQTFLANKFRLAQVTHKDQFIMCYGGIRGAIAFALVALLEEFVESRAIFFTTTIVVVMFTVFIQGSTIKPIVEYLRVKRADHHKPSLTEQIYVRMNEHLMAGIEDVLGHHGHHYWYKRWDVLNEKVFQHILIREKHAAKDTTIIKVFEKLNEKDALEYLREQGGFVPFGSSPSMSNLLGVDEDAMVAMEEPAKKDRKSVIDLENQPETALEDNNLDKIFRRPSNRKSHRISRHYLPDEEISGPKNLMQRSVHLHLRHMMRSERRRSQRKEGLYESPRNSRLQVRGAHMRNGSKEQLLREEDETVAERETKAVVRNGASNDKDTTFPWKKDSKVEHHPAPSDGENSATYDVPKSPRISPKPPKANPSPRPSPKPTPGSRTKPPQTGETKL
ncbi:Na(+)/H(+) exchanger beta-like [Anneissia japonica]|uniref:Na(+)/H(+) exchanger beta-like n=1 Tax=Anneissia japonica TaxID=1529436 RepID=UPI0014259017|nr:Na(+)/H(+) exchanger beta-like [Anneissia japonica]